MKHTCLAALAVLLAVGACTEQSVSEEDQSTAVEPVDSRVTDVKAATTLDDAVLACSESRNYGGTEYDVACQKKLVEVIEAEVMSEGFDEAFAFLQQEMEDGRVSSPVANATKTVLERWLRANAANQSRADLFRWRGQLPSEEEDTTFAFAAMRRIINDAL